MMPRLSRYKFVCVTLFVMGWLLSYPVNAQEMHWENVTVLYFAATGGTDREAALQQYLLFDEAVLDKHRDLLEQYKTFAEEFMQMSLNAEAPQMNKEIDEMIANAKQMMKEHPELADELKEQLKEVERMRGEYNSHADNEVKEYTYDPKEILRKMTNIAVGKRTFTDHGDIGNGMFAVKTGACYGSLEPDAFKRVTTPEKNEYTWGAIDYDGRFVIQPKYGQFRDCWAEADFIYLKTKDKNGTAIMVLSAMTVACAFRSSTTTTRILTLRTASVSCARTACLALSRWTTNSCSPSNTRRLKVGRRMSGWLLRTAKTGVSWTAV